MNNLLSEEEAREKLRALCDEAGGVGALAELIGVTISAVSHQLHGRSPIHGRVAAYMGIKICRETTITYEDLSK